MAAKPQISEAGHPSTPPSDTEPTLFLTSFLLIFDSWVRSTSGMTKAETPHHLAHPYHHPGSLNHLLQPVTAPQSTGMINGGASPSQPPWPPASPEYTLSPTSLFLFLGSSHPLKTTGAAVWRHGLSENTGSKTSCAQTISQYVLLNSAEFRRKLFVNPQYWC